MYGTAPSEAEALKLSSARCLPRHAPPGFRANGLATSSYWGKILRLDVESSTNRYRVPTNNPFVGRPGYLPEIWALGLRNPFRFSFDRATGDFYVSDVGQLAWEEIDFKAAGSPAGRNYGWPIKEGTHDYSVPQGIDLNALTAPITDYPHGAGPSAVVGGYVYRGPSSPRMDGLYFYGDFYSGQIFVLKRDGPNWLRQEVARTPHLISTFGEDDTGRLYLANYLSGTIYQIEDSGRVASPFFNPPGGTNATDIITLTTISPGATLHYVADRDGQNVSGSVL